MSVLGFAAILQPLLGKILDHYWEGSLVNGARVYNSAAYDAALFWFFVVTALAVVMVSLAKESNCEVTYDSKQ